MEDCDDIPNTTLIFRETYDAEEFHGTFRY